MNTPVSGNGGKKYRLLCNKIYHIDLCQLPQRNEKNQELPEKEQGSGFKIDAFSGRPGCFASDFRSKTIAFPAVSRY